MESASPVSEEGRQNEGTDGVFWRQLVLWAILLFVASGLLPALEWRLDLWNKAALNYPRLFGLWEASAIIAWFGLFLPCLFLFFLNQTDNRRIKVRLIFLLVLWAMTAFPLAGIDYFLRTRPWILSENAILYLPYRGWAVFTHGNKYQVDDPDTFGIHRPGSIIEGTINYGEHGDLIRLGQALVPDEPVRDDMVISSLREFNAYGMDAEFADVVVDDPEVLFLGDSFTFGYGLNTDQIWPTMVMTKMVDSGILPGGPEAGDPKKRAALVGKGGYSPAEGFHLLNRVAPEYRPKIAIVLFYENNDIGDIANQAKWRASTIRGTDPFRIALEKQPVFITAESPLHAWMSSWFALTDWRAPREIRATPWKLYIENESAEYLEFYPLIRQEPATIQWASRAIVEPIQPRRVELDGRDFQVAFSPQSLSQFSHPYSEWPKVQPGWPHIEQFLSDLKEWGDGNNTRVFLFLAPAKVRMLYPYLPEGELKFDREMWSFIGHFVEDYRYKELLELGSLRPGLEENGDAVSRALAEACAERGLDFLDLTEGMRREAEERGDPLYFPFDTHWGPEGNAAVAEIMMDHISLQLAPHAEN